MLHKCIVICEVAIPIHHSTDFTFVIFHLNAIIDRKIEFEGHRGVYPVV